MKKFTNFLETPLNIDLKNLIKLYLSKLLATKNSDKKNGGVIKGVILTKK